MKSKKNASSSANKQNLQYQIAVRAEAKENSRRNPRSATEHYTKDRSYACFHIAKREAGSCRCEYLNDLNCLHGFADLQSGIPEFVSGVNGGWRREERLPEEKPRNGDIHVVLNLASRGSFVLTRSPTSASRMDGTVAHITRNRVLVVSQSHVLRTFCSAVL
jgi:hypothetical protein